MPLIDTYNEFERFKKINWDSENTPAHWWEGEPILTYLANAYIIVTSEIERFTIKTAHLVSDKITDRSLKESWGDLIREESAHAYVHTKISNDFKRHKYPIRFMIKYSNFFFRVASKLSIKSKMALVLAMEFYAHELALLAFRANFFPVGKLAIYDFLNWHIEEELTHSDLCFRVYKCLGNNYILRIAMLSLFTFFTFFTILLFMPLFFFIDAFQGRKMKFKNLCSTYKFLYKHKKFMWKGIKNYFSFFIPRFNPKNTQAKITLPYFDFLFAELERPESPTQKSFGKHVHWGYWQNPSLVKYTHDDYYEAAENLTKKFCAIGKINNNQFILDVGCGFGGTISQLNDQYKDMTLTGLNIDKRQLIRAKSLVAASSTNYINFVEGNACVLPFPANHFDKILAVECIFHFPSRKSFFKESFRVLKPGGMIILSDFIPNPLFLPYCWVVSWPLFKKINFFGSCNVNYTLRRYRQLANSYGLEMEIFDITRNVLPTYTYLGYLSNSLHTPQPYRSLIRPFLWTMRFLFRTSLLRYQILSFKKSSR
jgi:predicted metal-dependent hydrolase/ubiquinone/menaquinone biosynthesis C-methylase UbiE